MLRTIICDEEYIAALDAMFDNPMLADEWQRMQVERVLAQEVAFDADVYQAHRGGNAARRVLLTSEAAGMPRMIVFFTLEENEAIRLRALEVLPLYNVPSPATPPHALAF